MIPLFFAFSILSYLQAEFTKKEVLLNLRADQSDLAGWAATQGIDLLLVIQGCLDENDPRRQERSWKLFHWFLIHCGADGAAGEELGAVGSSLAHYTDDEVLYKLIAESPLEQVRDLPFSPRHHFRYDKLTKTHKNRCHKFNIVGH